MQQLGLSNNPKESELHGVADSHRGGRAEGGSEEEAGMDSGQRPATMRSHYIYTYM